MCATSTRCYVVAKLLCYLGVEMQCGQGCEIERTWHVGKDLQVKNTKTSFFFYVWGQKINASTNVNSWKRLQSHANTNRNASHVKMRMSQNPGRVAKLQTEMLEKRSNCAGSLRAAWPCFCFNLINGNMMGKWCEIIWAVDLNSVVASRHWNRPQMALLYTLQ